MKKIVILQSSYIPWRGYFDLIHQADEFIFYDDVQFTKRDWRSRNMIKTPEGTKWLSIPVMSKGQYFQKINEVKLLDHKWCSKHWSSICHAYAKAPFFSDYRLAFEEMYRELNHFTTLSEVNKFLIQNICEILGIKTTFSESQDYGFSQLSQTERLVALCKKAKATTYLSGPSARNYLQEDLFKQENIQLEYMNYDKYVPYPQKHGAFISTVSILDLIFNIGPSSLNYITSQVMPIF